MDLELFAVQVLPHKAALLLYTISETIKSVFMPLVGIFLQGILDKPYN